MDSKKAASIEPKVVRADTGREISQEEAEARLRKEGYESFCWYDVPGATYPTHRHEQDECLWILQGELHLVIDGQSHELKPGDRIYLPARTAHQARALPQKGVTYLVGKKVKS